MQLMHQNKSQSEALKNLVERIPVKEREKLSNVQPVIVKSSTSRINPFSQARLNLEIATYWFLSKYSQSRRHKAQKGGIPNIKKINSGNFLES